MCRHMAYLGPPATLAELGLAGGVPGGLYEQSWAPRMQRYGTVNADGFGIGWHPSPDGSAPARYRRAVPIWADPNLPDLARCIRSGSVLAAVRDATPGTSQEESAAAPYRGGRWLFSHNGAVADWTRLPADTGTAPDPQDLLQLEARCDSALLWALVQARLRGGDPPDRALAAVVRWTVAQRPQARVNLLLTDGRTIAATRCGDTLWYRAHPDGLTVASEPMGPAGPDGQSSGTDQAGAAGAFGPWQEVPDRSLLLATRAAVRTVPLDLPSAPPAPDPAPTADRVPGPTADAEEFRTA